MCEYIKLLNKEETHSKQQVILSAGFNWKIAVFSSFYSLYKQQFKVGIMFTFLDWNLLSLIQKFFNTLQLTTLRQGKMPDEHDLQILLSILVIKIVWGWVYQYAWASFYTKAGYKTV